MLIRNVRHRGLLRFLETNDSRGLRGDLVPRLRRMIGVLSNADDMAAVISTAPPGWRIHQLKGDREGVWSLSVSGNWRLTFDVVDGEVCDLGLEDYH